MIVHDDQDFNFPLETIAPFVQNFANKTGVPVGGRHAASSEIFEMLPRANVMNSSIHSWAGLILWKRCKKPGVESLPGGFKYFLFSSLPGEMIQFDEHIFQMGWTI